MNHAELRQTFNAITRNFESANETAQVGIYSFTETYVDPCLSGFKACLYDCTSPCFPNRDDHLRRKSGRSRGRGDLDFDFYDDWDADEANSATGMGWANDELDSLLAGRGVSQPQRQRAMSYGARARRNDSDTDPNMIPKSSYLGFLDRLPFRIGSRGLKYKPSASGLQENPGGLRIRDVEAAEPLMEEYDEVPHGGDNIFQGHKRQRSDTQASRSTATTRSARSDLIMSDEEDDAVPLDDEFAVMLSRRNTNLSTEDHISNKSGRAGSRKRPSNSRVSSRTVSSPSVKSVQSRRSSSMKSLKSGGTTPKLEDNRPEPPSIVDLKKEEDQLREQEEMEIMQKREAAAKLAEATGLGMETKAIDPDTTTEPKSITPSQTPLRPTIRTPSVRSPFSETNSEGVEPFPSITSPTKSVDEPP